VKDNIDGASAKSTARLNARIDALVASANDGTPAQRRVNLGAAREVVRRSLKSTQGRAFSQREHIALTALSHFITLAQRDKSVALYPANTDLLPLGHPRSTASNALTAFALREHRARWFAADHRVLDEHRALVASALAAEYGSMEHFYALSMLEQLNDGSALVALVASFGDGNSRAARSARARRQRRDRFGRFAYQGGGLRSLLRFGDGSVRSLTGSYVKDSDDGESFDVETPDGTLYRIPASKAESVKAVLFDSPDGFSPMPAKYDSSDPIIDVADLVKIDMPSGYIEKSRDKDGSVTYGLANGDDYLIRATPAGNGTTAYEVVRNDGKDTPVGLASNWSDVHKMVVQDGKKANREDAAKARLEGKSGPESDYLDFLPDVNIAAKDEGSEVRRQAQSIMDFFELDELPDGMSAQQLADRTRLNADALKDGSLKGGEDLAQDFYDAADAIERKSGLAKPEKKADLTPAPSTAPAPEAGKWEPSDTRIDLPYKEPIIGPDGNLTGEYKDGTANIVDINGRKVVVVDINGTPVPFYLSSGDGGKKDVEAGKWYPFFGWGMDGWMNKGKSDEINDYYGSPELRAQAEWLDANIGDIRDDKSIPRDSSSQGNLDMWINDHVGLKPASNDTPTTRTEFDANVAEIKRRIEAGNGGSNKEQARLDATPTPESGGTSASPEQIAELRRLMDERNVRDNVPDLADGIEKLIADNTLGKEQADRLISGIRENRDVFPEPDTTPEKAPSKSDDFNAPEGAYALNQTAIDNFEPQGRVDESSTDFTDDPSELAQRFDTDDLTAALEQALIGEDGADGDVQGRGAGNLQFNRGDEWVPAEALYQALDQQDEDARAIANDIYDSARKGQMKEQARLDGAPLPEKATKDETPVSAPEKPAAQSEMKPLKELKKGDVVRLEDGTLRTVSEVYGVRSYNSRTNSFDGSTEVEFTDGSTMRRSNEDARNKPDFEVVSSESESGVNIPENLPSLLEDLSPEDRANYEQTGDYRPYLPENADIPDYPSSMYQMDQSPLSPEEIGPLAEDAPQGFDNDPMRLATEYNSETLTEELTNALTGDNERDLGYGYFGYTDENGEEWAGNIPAEAIRDALQLQGVNTDQIVQDAIDKTAKAPEGVEVDVPEKPSREPSAEPLTDVRYSDAILLSNPELQNSIDAALEDAMNEGRNIGRNATRSSANRLEVLLNEQAMRRAGASRADRVKAQRLLEQIQALRDTNMPADFSKPSMRGGKKDQDKEKSLVDQFNAIPGVSQQRYRLDTPSKTVEKQGGVPSLYAPSTIEVAPGLNWEQRDNGRSKGGKFGSQSGSTYIISGSRAKDLNPDEMKKLGFYWDENSQSWINYNGAVGNMSSKDKKNITDSLSKSGFDVNPAFTNGGFIPSWLRDSADVVNPKIVETVSAPRPRRPSPPGRPITDGRLRDLLEQADGDPKKFRELLGKENVHVFDFETTGIRFDENGNMIDSGEPWAISVARYNPATGEMEQKTFYMNPGQSIKDTWAGGTNEDGSPRAIDSDGKPLTDEWLAQQPSQAEALQAALDFMGQDPILFGHNSTFDHDTFTRKADELGLDYRPAAIGDTMSLSQLVHDGEQLPSHSLGYLAKHHGIPSQGTAHTADADTRTTAALLDKLLTKAERAELGMTPENLDRWQGKNEDRYNKALADYNEANAPRVATEAVLEAAQDPTEVPSPEETSARVDKMIKDMSGNPDGAPNPETDIVDESSDGAEPLPNGYSRSNLHELAQSALDEFDRNSDINSYTQFTPQEIKEVQDKIDALREMSNDPSVSDEQVAAALDDIAEDLDAMVSRLGDPNDDRTPLRNIDIIENLNRERDYVTETADMLRARNGENKPEPESDDTTNEVDDAQVRDQMAGEAAGIRNIVNETGSTNADLTDEERQRFWDYQTRLEEVIALVRGNRKDEMGDRDLATYVNRVAIDLKNDFGPGGELEDVAYSRGMDRNKVENILDLADKLEVLTNRLMQQVLDREGSKPPAVRTPAIPKSGPGSKPEAPTKPEDSGQLKPLKPANNPSRDELIDIRSNFDSLMANETDSEIITMGSDISNALNDVLDLIEADPDGKNRETGRSLDALAGDIQELADVVEDDRLKSFDGLLDRIRTLSRAYRRRNREQRGGNGTARNRRQTPAAPKSEPVDTPETKPGPDAPTVTRKAQFTNPDTGARSENWTLSNGDQIIAIDSVTGSGIATVYYHDDEPEVRRWDTDNFAEALQLHLAERSGNSSSASREITQPNPSNLPPEVKVGKTGKTGVGAKVPDAPGERAVGITNGADLPSAPPPPNSDGPVGPNGERLLRRGRENRNFWDHPIMQSWARRRFRKPLEGQFVDRSRVPIAYGDRVVHTNPKAARSTLRPDGTPMTGVVLNRQDNVGRENGHNRDHVTVQWENGTVSHYVSHNLQIVGLTEADTEWRTLVHPDETPDTPESERIDLPAGFDWNQKRRGAAPSGRMGPNGRLSGEGRGQNNIPVEAGDESTRFERGEGVEGLIADFNGVQIQVGDRVYHRGKVGSRRGLTGGTVIGKKYIARYRTITDENGNKKRVRVGYAYQPIVRWDNDPEIKEWSANQLIVTTPDAESRNVSDAPIPTLRREGRGASSKWVPDTEAPDYNADSASGFEPIPANGGGSGAPSTPTPSRSRRVQPSGNRPGYEFVGSREVLFIGTSEQINRLIDNYAVDDQEAELFRSEIVDDTNPDGTQSGNDQIILSIDQGVTNSGKTPREYVEGVLDETFGSASSGTSPTSSTPNAPEADTSTPDDGMVVQPKDKNGQLLDLGDIVEANNGKRGMVRGFTPDGKVRVKYEDGRYGKLNADKLSRTGQTTRGPADPTGAVGEPVEGEFGEWGARAEKIREAKNRGPADLTDLIQRGDDALPPGKTLKDLMQEVWGLEHKYKDKDGNERSLRAEVTGAHVSRGRQISVSMRILDENGRVVGTMSRQLKMDNNGNLSVYHAYFEITDSKRQGTGFATAINRYAEDFYIAQGVREIGVQAALSNGGYTWAKQGFEWDHPHYGTPWADPLRRLGEYGRRGNMSPALRKVYDDLMWRFRNLDPSDPNFPTPQEIVMFGWTPGATSWPGKSILVGSGWYGVKRLRPGGRRTTQGERDNGKWWHDQIFRRNNQRKA